MKKVLFIGFTHIQIGMARKFLAFRNLATEIEILAEQQSSVGVVAYVVNGDDPSSPDRLALHLRLHPGPALAIGACAVPGATAYMPGPFKPATADRLGEMMLGTQAAPPSATATATATAPRSTSATTGADAPAGNVLAFPGAAAGQDADVLVVDDSDIVQRTMVRKITEYGQRVDVASNGPDALAMLQGHRYKLVFLDVLMPGMDGFEVCKRIKKSAEYKSTAVYMLSSKDGMFDKVRGTMAGCNGYLVKPLEARKLREVLDKHFERSSRFPESEFVESRTFADSSQPDSQFHPGRPAVTRARPVRTAAGATATAAPASPVRSANAASPPPPRPARTAADNEKLLEPYRASLSNAFAATEPAKLEDLPSFKLSSNKLANAASPPAARPARTAADKEKLLEPYRAGLSNAFAATEPAKLEDLPDFKPSSNGRGG